MIAKNGVFSTLVAGVLVLMSVAAVVAQAAGAATPSQAVNALVGPLATPGPGGGSAGCNALTGQLADCPITARLRSRLSSPIPGVENGNLVSRSQNPPSALDVAEVKLPGDATQAQVNTRWVYGTGQQTSEYVITFVVLKEAGGWLVDDSYCLNDPATSVYNQPTGPCPLTNTTGGVPGMPSTGAGYLGEAYALVALVGLAIVGLGLVLVRRSRGRMT